MARLIEDRNQLQHNSSLHPQYLSNGPRSSPSPEAGLLGPPLNLNTSPTQVAPPVPIHRITGQEARARREKGLCYYCDEKFIPGHHCERPQLFMLKDVTPTNNMEQTNHFARMYPDFLLMDKEILRSGE